MSIIFTLHFNRAFQNGGQLGTCNAIDWQGYTLTLALPQSSRQRVVTLSSSLGCSGCSIGAQNVLQTLLVGCNFHRQGCLLSNAQLVQHVCLESSNALETNLQQPASALVGRTLVPKSCL